MERDPRFTPLYGILARAYAAMTSAGRTGWKRASGGLTINGDDAQLNRAYAYALQSVGSYSEAIDYLRRAIELRPAYLPTQFELAGLVSGAR